MNDFLYIEEIDDLKTVVDEAISLKKKPMQFNTLGTGKTIGLLFFNNSLRTRLSTQKAAQNLGLNVIVMNFGSEGWQLEFEDGVVMDAGKAEHIREAAKVVAQYCDIIAIRAFASLEDKVKDKAELVLESFRKYAGIPVVNMESATAHPLQALADAITMEEHRSSKRPKVVLTWAPHPRALPHAVANSFIRMMKRQDAEFIITHPKGYDLDPEVVGQVTVEYDQNKALRNADFVYAKNWSAFESYGKVLHADSDWTISETKMALTNTGKFMHCLPVRRNVVVTDTVIDSKDSLVIEQANNRTYAAQVILKKILENG